MVIVSLKLLGLYVLDLLKVFNPPSTVVEAEVHTYKSNNRKRVRQNNRRKK